MIKTITLQKEFKKSLGNYSNITAGMYITWELKEDEKFDYNAGWDLINQEISSQTDTDASWIKTDEHKNFYKTTIKVKKGGEK